jgi:hypothetical protein
MQVADALGLRSSGGRPSGTGVTGSTGEDDLPPP